MHGSRSALWLAASALLWACSDGVSPPVCELEARLQPGEALITDPTLSEPGCGLMLPSGAAGSRYRVALVRPDSAGPEATSTVTLVVEGVGVTGAPISVSEGPLPTAATAASAELLETVAETRGFHEAVRRSEEDLVRQIGTRGLLLDRQGARLPEGLAAAPAAPRVSFDPATSCSSPRVPRTALLRGENDLMAIYQDSADIAFLPVRSEHVERMLAYFATYGKDIVETYFGRLPDVDGNGRVIVVITSFPFSADAVVAYVWAGNYYARATCPASDEMEVIYLNPARVRSMDRGEFVALGVLSHESQHLVSLFNRLARTRRTNSQTFLSHPVWIEEGRAELADEVTSRRAWSLMPGGPARTARVDGAQLEQGLRNNRAEAFGVVLEGYRTIWYLSSQPNGLAVTPNGAPVDADIRNGGWHFHRWLADAYGRASSSAGADAALFRELTDSLTASGGDGLRGVLGRSFDTLFEEFIAGVMLHGASASTSVGAFSTYDFVSLTTVLGTTRPGAYPWPVTTSVSGSATSTTRSFESARYAGSIGPTGVRIHDFTSNGTGTGARLTVESTTPLRLVIVRLR
jgi:hypothetical protein